MSLLEESMIRFRCSNCNKLLGIDNSEAGRFTRCVKCKERVKIPARGEDNPGKGKKAAKPGPAGQKGEGLADADDYEVIEDFEVIEEGDAGEQVDSLEEVDALEEVEDLDEIELVDEEEEEPRRRPKKRPGKGKARRRREEEEEETFFTRNRITVIAGLVVGPAFLVFGIMWHFDNELDLILRIIIMVLGGLIMLSGLFYVIKG